MLHSPEYHSDTSQRSRTSDGVARAVREPRECVPRQASNIVPARPASYSPGNPRSAYTLLMMTRSKCAQGRPIPPKPAGRVRRRRPSLDCIDDLCPDVSRARRGDVLKSSVATPHMPRSVQMLARRVLAWSPQAPPPPKRRTDVRPIAAADARNSSFATRSRRSGAAKAPLDVLVSVFEFLPRSELADSCTRVSRSWHAAAETPALWRDEELFDDAGFLNTLCVRARLVSAGSAGTTLRGVSRVDGTPLLLRFSAVPMGRGVSDLPTSYIRVHCLANMVRSSQLFLPPLPHPLPPSRANSPPAPHLLVPQPGLRESPSVAPIIGVGRMYPYRGVVAERDCGITLCGALRHRQARDLGPPDPEAARALCEGVMSGLAAFHGASLLHGSVHPHSVLVSNARGLRPGASRPVQARLRICSSGQLAATAVASEREAAPPLPYRAPEMLLGDPALAPAEVWAAACVVAEALLGQPLVSATSGVEALFRIFRLRGTPSVGAWRSLGRYRYATGAPGTLSRDVFPRWPPGMLGAVLRARLQQSQHWLPAEVDAAVDWLVHAMALDPDRRPSAAACLDHPFLRPGSPRPTGYRLPCALPDWSVPSHIAQRHALHDIARGRLMRAVAGPVHRVDEPRRDARLALGIWLHNFAHSFNVRSSALCTALTLLDKCYPSAPDSEFGRVQGLAVLAVVVDTQEEEPLSEQDLEQYTMRALNIHPGAAPLVGPIFPGAKEVALQKTGHLAYTVSSAYSVALAAAALVGYPFLVAPLATVCCEAAATVGAEVPCGGPLNLAAAALLMGKAASSCHPVVWVRGRPHCRPRLTTAASLSCHQRPTLAAGLGGGPHAVHRASRRAVSCCRRQTLLRAAFQRLLLTRSRCVGQPRGLGAGRGWP